MKLPQSGVGRMQRGVEAYRTAGNPRAAPSLRAERSNPGVKRTKPPDCDASLRAPAVPLKPRPAWRNRVSPNQRHGRSRKHPTSAERSTEAQRGRVRGNLRKPKMLKEGPHPTPLPASEIGFTRFRQSKGDRSRKHPTSVEREVGKSNYIPALMATFQTRNERCSSG
jgi:hypothetical protein